MPAVHIVLVHAGPEAHMQKPSNVHITHSSTSFSTLHFLKLVETRPLYTISNSNLKLDRIFMESTRLELSPKLLKTGDGVFARAEYRTCPA
jgi:hypothetical protein